jgi:hypothetical protein
MKDVIVCSAYTHRQHMIDEYEDQLAAAGIDFHLEPITLENGIVSITARWKFEYMRRMCERFDMYERIVFTDAWDVLFFGTKVDLMTKIPVYPIVSAERNCWPEEDLAESIQFPTPTPWRYVNAGMIAGHPRALLSFREEALRKPDLDLMEQAWFNRRLVAKDSHFVTDIVTQLFYTVSYDREDGSLKLKDGKLWNSRFDTYPQFFHFAGPCSSVPFRAMLRGATSSLCASA